MENLTIKGIGGYLICRSSLGEYRHCDFDGCTFEFKRGVNIIRCDIDGGGWQVCYILGCSDEEYSRFIPLDSAPAISCDGTPVTLDEVRNCAFYVDRIFEDDTSAVREIITRNLNEYKSGSGETPESIRKMFGLDRERFGRPLGKSGNEQILQLAAIGYSMGKSIFCFPWLSARMTEYYMGYIKHIFDVLTELGAIVILPTSFDRDCGVECSIIEM